jgi:hypothetical protein
MMKKTVVGSCNSSRYRRRRRCSLSKSS